MGDEVGHLECFPLFTWDGVSLELLEGCGPWVGSRGLGASWFGWGGGEVGRLGMGTCF